eukprot:11430132-Alexandrium_andersonii.AAC.1
MCIRDRFSESQSAPANSYYLMGYAHLASALYTMHSKHPENTNVETSVHRGLKHCRVWDAQTPEDVLTYIGERHNKFNKGSSKSFVELYQLVKPIEAKWAIYKAENQVTS